MSPLRSTLPPKPRPDPSSLFTPSLTPGTTSRRHIKAPQRLLSPRPRTSAFLPKRNLIKHIRSRQEEFAVQFDHLHHLHADICGYDILDTDAGGDVAAFAEEVGQFAALGDRGRGVFLLEEAEARD